jgi:uncharacterized membrane protein YheB (UPF0754 family)
VSISEWISVSSIPVVSGFIGWLTNKVALFMLFRPRTQKKVLFLKMQGLVPMRQPEMAASIAETVSKRLVNREAVEKELSSAAVRDALVSGLVNYGRRYITELTELLPRPVKSVVGKQIEKELDRRLRKGAEKHVPRLMEEMVPAIAGSVDFRRRVEGEIASYPPEKLERLINEIAGRELRAIEIWGGIFGFMIGMFQAAMVMLLK